MAASDFSYADYLLFAGATDVNHSLFSTVAGGVIGLLNNQYYIYPEVATISKEVFVTAASFDLPAEPINTITSLTYDGTVIPTSTYTWYGREVVLGSPILSYKKPITAVLEVGYTELPADLKLAIYRHIDTVIFAMQKHTDNIDKAVNKSGNTTSYRDTVIPSAVRGVYTFYSPRKVILA